MSAHSFAYTQRTHVSPSPYAQMHAAHGSAVTTSSGGTSSSSPRRSSRAYFPALPAAAAGPPSSSGKGAANGSAQWLHTPRTQRMLQLLGVEADAETTGGTAAPAAQKHQLNGPAHFQPQPQQPHSHSPSPSPRQSPPSHRQQYSLSATSPAHLLSHSALSPPRLAPRPPPSGSKQQHQQPHSARTAAEEKESGYFVTGRAATAGYNDDDATSPRAFLPVSGLRRHWRQQAAALSTGAGGLGVGHVSRNGRSGNTSALGGGGGGGLHPLTPLAESGSSPRGGGGGGGGGAEATVASSSATAGAGNLASERFLPPQKQLIVDYLTGSSASLFPTSVDGVSITQVQLSALTKLCGGDARAVVRQLRSLERQGASFADVDALLQAVEATRARAGALLAWLADPAQCRLFGRSPGVGVLDQEAVERLVRESGVSRLSEVQQQQQTQPSATSDPTDPSAAATDATSPAATAAAPSVHVSRSPTQCYDDCFHILLQLNDSPSPPQCHYFSQLASYVREVVDGALAAQHGQQAQGQGGSHATASTRVAGAGSSASAAAAAGKSSASAAPAVKRIPNSARAAAGRAAAEARFLLRDKSPPASKRGSTGASAAASAHASAAGAGAGVAHPAEEKVDAGSPSSPAPSSARSPSVRNQRLSSRARGGAAAAAAAQPAPGEEAETQPQPSPARSPSQRRKTTTAATATKSPKPFVTRRSSAASASSTAVLPTTISDERSPLANARAHADSHGGPSLAGLPPPALGASSPAAHAVDLQDQKRRLDVVAFLQSSSCTLLRPRPDPAELYRALLGSVASASSTAADGAAAAAVAAAPIPVGPHTLHVLKHIEADNLTGSASSHPLRFHSLAQLLTYADTLAGPTPAAAVSDAGAWNEHPQSLKHGVLLFLASPSCRLLPSPSSPSSSSAGAGAQELLDEQAAERIVEESGAGAMTLPHLRGLKAAGRSFPTQALLIEALQNVHIDYLLRKQGRPPLAAAVAAAAAAAAATAAAAAEAATSAATNSDAGQEQEQQQEKHLDTTSISPSPRSSAATTSATAATGTLVSPASDECLQAVGAFLTDPDTTLLPGGVALHDEDVLDLVSGGGPDALEQLWLLQEQGAVFLGVDALREALVRRKDDAAQQCSAWVAQAGRKIRGGASALFGEGVQAKDLADSITAAQVQSLAQYRGPDGPAATPRAVLLHLDLLLAHMSTSSTRGAPMSSWVDLTSRVAAGLHAEDAAKNMAYELLCHYRHVLWGADSGVLVTPLLVDELFAWSCAGPRVVEFVWLWLVAAREGAAPMLRRFHELTRAVRSVAAAVAREQALQPAASAVWPERCALPLSSAGAATATADALAAHSTFPDVDALELLAHNRANTALLRVALSRAGGVLHRQGEASSRRADGASRAYSERQSAFAWGEQEPHAHSAIQRRERRERPGWVEKPRAELVALVDSVRGHVLPEEEAVAALPVVSASAGEAAPTASAVPFTIVPPEILPEQQEALVVAATKRRAKRMTQAVDIHYVRESGLLKSKPTSPASTGDAAPVAAGSASSVPSAASPSGTVPPSPMLAGTTAGSPLEIAALDEQHAAMDAATRRRKKRATQTVSGLAEHVRMAAMKRAATSGASSAVGSAAASAAVSPSFAPEASAVPPSAVPPAFSSPVFAAASASPVAIAAMDSQLATLTEGQKRKAKRATQTVDPLLAASFYNRTLSTEPAPAKNTISRASTVTGLGIAAANVSSVAASPTSASTSAPSTGIMRSQSVLLASPTSALAIAAADEETAAQLGNMTPLEVRRTKRATTITSDLGPPSMNSPRPPYSAYGSAAPSVAPSPVLASLAPSASPSPLAGPRRLGGGAAGGAVDVAHADTQVNLMSARERARSRRMTQALHDASYDVETARRQRLADEQEDALAMQNAAATAVSSS